MKFADIKNDVAFHKIFGNAQKTITLISFLNAVLHLEGAERIESVVLQNPYLFPTIPAGKISIIDVRATDQLGRSFIVEMQIAEKKGFDKRIQYYASRDYAAQIGSGEDYPQLRPTYLIAILDFYFTQNPNYFSLHQITDSQTGEHLLKDIKFYFIELKKFNKSIDDLENMMDKWIYFIKNAPNLSFIPRNIDDEGLITAYQTADQYTWNKAELNTYHDAQVQEADLIQRILFSEEKGIEKGRKEAEAKAEKEKEQMILKMHKAGISNADIADFVVKTELEVQQIIEKYKNN